MKGQNISKVVRVHPLGTKNICAKLNVNTSEAGMNKKNNCLVFMLLDLSPTILIID